MWVLVVLSLIISFFIGLTAAWEILGRSNKSKGIEYGMGTYLKKPIEYLVNTSRKK